MSGPLKKACGNLYEFICKDNALDEDPTGTVRSDEEGEKQAHEIYQEIIKAHPDWNTATIDEEFVQRVFNPQSRARIQTAFYWVKRTLRQWIERQPQSIFTVQEKTQLKDQIRRVELIIPPPATLYENEPDLLTKTELFYERKADGGQVVRVGGGYVLMAKSWFNVVFSLAHELGHSIDPCEIRSLGLSFPAYDRLVACLMEQKLVTLRANRTECGRNDQLSETFADWIAVQVTTDTLHTYAGRLQPVQLQHAARNSVKDLCDKDFEHPDPQELETYPSAKVRIEAIFGQNPKIRQFLGCEDHVNSMTYCTLLPRPYHPKGIPYESQKPL
jgi:hypothetical protein